MQDIPRNELLDKLAAGWKVRRKNWMNPTDTISSKNECNTKLWQYLQCDWEGEPPTLKKLLMNCTLYSALDFKAHNPDKATHIRRMDWPADNKLTFQNEFQLVPSNPDLKFIKLECLYESDWEVWGHE